MKKRLVALLLVAGLIATSFVGCGKATQSNTGTDASESTNTATETTETTETTGSGEKKIINVWSKDRHDTDYVQKKIDEYNKANTDNVQVVYTIYSDNYQQAVQLAAQNGELPDVLVQTDGIFQEFLGADQWLDYTPYMDEEMKEFFSDVTVSGWNKIGDSIYFFPTTGTVCRLFYNKEIFERAGIENPPATLEEMVEDAKSITQQLSGEGIYGFAANMKSPTSAFARSLVVGTLAETGYLGGFNFTTGEYDFSVYKDALKSWDALLSEECAFPGCESLDIDPLRTQFAAGKIGMYISFSHAEPGVYANQFPMDTNLWDCVPIPTSGGKITGKYSYSGTSAYLINSKTEDPALTFKVYKDLFASLDYLKGYYEGGYGVSIINAVKEVASPSADYANKKWLTIDFTTDALVPGAPDQKLASNFVLEGEIYHSVFADIIYNDTDMDAALEDLTKRYTAAYEAAVANVGYDLKIEGYDPMNPTMD